MNLKTGDLAYFDAYMFGLIPCRVVSIKGTSGHASTSQTITVVLTASRGQYDTYKRGETIETTGLHVYPRAAVRGRRVLPYTVEV